MMYLILTFISVAAAAKLSGIILTGNYALIFIFVIALTILNCLIRPIINFLSWPINLLTFGLFSFVLNILFLILTGFLAVKIFNIDIWHALYFSIILVIFQTILHKFDL